MLEKNKESLFGTREETPREGSLTNLVMTRKKETANFVGLWAPTFLLIGIYNKLVKLEGSDRYSK